MSAHDEIDGMSGTDRERLLRGEWQSDPAGYVRKLARGIDPRDRDDRRAEIRSERDRLVQLYQDDVIFRTHVLALTVNRADAEPTGVIYDLLRSGFASLVLALAESVEAQRQATLQARQVQRIELALPADYATSERSPNWLREMVLEAKRDQEGKPE